jgi:hypothetical protein
MRQRSMCDRWGKLKLGKLDIYSGELRWDLTFNLNMMISRRRMCNIIKKENINANITKLRTNFLMSIKCSLIWNAV